MDSELNSSSLDSDSKPITLTVSFRGTSHTLTLPLSTPLATLHSQLEDLTDVPQNLQKLLYKGKKLTWISEEHAHNTTLGKAGIKDNGMKVLVLGSKASELEGLRKEEGEYFRREKIMRERAMKPPAKVRSTGSGITSSSSPSLQYRFHNLQPLSHLPDASGALSFLQKLASDPAISHIMQKHQFSVGVLTELAPHEHPELLGLNVNKGMEIKLRLRTNRYDGFRDYKEVRKVLCHELSHNVWGDHDEKFKELNSKLNHEVVDYERSITQNTHYLGSSEVYQPSSELEAEAQAYILGGTGSSPDLSAETQEERRRKILEATVNRLRKEEEQIEHSCGTRMTSDSSS